MSVDKKTPTSSIDADSKKNKVQNIIDDKKVKDSSQNEFFSTCANKVLNLTGWYCEPIPHEYKKAVIAYAPHTSNWDFPIDWCAIC